MLPGESAASASGDLVFSVVVPTYNRPQRLATCLAGLAAMSFPRDRFEVIVSDDGGAVPLAPVVEAYRDRLRIVLLTNPRSGPAGARNHGVARAEGTHLAFLDDDCVPAPDWLTVLGRWCRDSPPALLGGCVLNGLPDNPFAVASQHLVSYLCEYYGSKPDGAPFFTSNNMAVHAGVFRQLGGFDTGFPRAAGEDREFCDRWHAHGYTARYVPDAVVYHAHQLTLTSFWRQHFNYGRAALRFHQLRARRDRLWILPERPAFYLEMLRYPFSRGTGRGPWVHAALMAMSQVANAAGALGEGLARSRRLAREAGPRR